MNLMHSGEQDGVRYFFRGWTPAHRRSSGGQFRGRLTYFGLELGRKRGHSPSWVRRLLRRMVYGSGTRALPGSKKTADGVHPTASRRVVLGRSKKRRLPCKHGQTTRSASLRAWFGRATQLNNHFSSCTCAPSQFHRHIRYRKTRRIAIMGRLSEAAFGWAVRMCRLGWIAPAGVAAPFDCAQGRLCGRFPMKELQRNGG